MKELFIAFSKLNFLEKIFTFFIMYGTVDFTRYISLKIGNFFKL